MGRGNVVPVEMMLLLLTVSVALSAALGNIQANASFAQQYVTFVQHLRNSSQRWCSFVDGKGFVAE
jgi:hypothetical protein